jgi:hypothetical protein
VRFNTVSVISHTSFEMGMLFCVRKKPQSRVTEYDKALLVRYEIFVTIV